MPIYKFDSGKINGIFYANCRPVLTTEGLKIRIRFAGEPTSFIEGTLADFVDAGGSAFASVDALVTYWNANMVNLAVVVMT